MPTQKEIDWENTVSKNSQRARRESTVNQKSGGIFDVDTGYYKPLEPNQQTGRRNIEDDGVDTPSRSRTEADDGGGGGGGEFELDVVKDDNTAGRASFTGGGII